MNKLTKIILDCHKGQIPETFSQYNREEREEAIKKQLLSTLGIETYDKVSFRKALRRKEVELFEVIEEIVQSNFVTGDAIMSDFAKRFAEIKNLSLGDENLFYVEGKHDLIVSEYSGAHMNARRQRFQSGQSFKLEMRNFIVATFVYVEQLLAGRLTLEKFVNAIYEAVDKRIGQLIVDAFNTGITNTPATYRVVGAYNEENILKMLEKLEALNGAKPILTGTTSAIRKLQGITNLATGGRLSEKMKDGFNENFILPVWNGFECIEISNAIQAGTIDTLVLDTNKIYAICGDTKIVKVVFEGDPIVKENITDKDNADLTQDYVVSFKANAAVAYSGMLGYIELT